MFMVGVALPWSIANRQARGQTFGLLFGHAVWRALLLVLLAVFLTSAWSKQTEWVFTNVLAQIEASKSRDLWHLIYGLGIRHVGERTAGILAREFGSLERLSHATVEELDNIHEIGLTMAQSIHDWFEDEGNRRLCERLRAAGVRTEAEKRVRD